MSEQPHLVVEPLTPEEDAQLRRQQLELDYVLHRVARSVGGHVSTRGGHDHVILNPEVFGLEPPDADDEHRELKLPRILRNSVFVPTEDRTLTPLAFTAPFRKTPKKEREFFDKCTRKPELPRHIAIEAGADYERRAIEPVNSTGLALDKLGATPDEPVRAVLVDCKDEKLAAETVDSKRDRLPWCENLKLRPDGSLPADWHKSPLSVEERNLLTRQQAEDRAAKRARRDKVIRQMQREPI
jgi:hypothetical protein